MAGEPRLALQSGADDRVLSALLAAHLTDRGIRVNAIAPGPVWTPLKPADRQGEQGAKFGSQTPMKRAAQPAEIAPAFVFMAAPSCSSYITGEILPVVGGC
jgi:NAD(P)-dependent dehydrogenase (short-subunit alcohol dehydrogenase family)